MFTALEIVFSALRESAERCSLMYTNYSTYQWLCMVKNSYSRTTVFPPCYFSFSISREKAPDEAIVHQGPFNYVEWVLKAD